MTETLISAVRARVTIDVDSMNPLVAARHAAEARFQDMTSNQAIAYGESTRSEQATVLAEAIKTARATLSDAVEEDALVDQVVDVFTVLLAKNVIPHISGRVHAQTAPETAFNTEATIAHAKKLVALFEEHGIPKERVCIKIPATGPSILACAYLEKIGIRTLATCLFSVSQALAAHQAGCLYVAPYFNELRVHFEPDLWKKYDDTAREHPMGSVIHEIVATYKSIGAKTLVMPASVVTGEEVVALVSLQPNHLTLSGAVLDLLAAIQNNALPEPPALPAASSLTTTDYLASDAQALAQAIESDAEVNRKLADALLIFGDMEEKLRALIRTQLHV
ncbi:unnamed protein product [Peniophora sp. CBMAI 1063]|nr:unnamed protein product [Peniophora sp. CBMAI 1063]